MATLRHNVVDPQRAGVDPGCGWCKWWEPFEDEEERGTCRHPNDPQEQPTMYFNGCDLWLPHWDARAHIERIRIRGFRSLADVEFRPPPGASVLIGANGSGKSNFVQFINLLSWMLKARRLAEFVNREGGADDQLHGGNETTPRLDAEIAIRTDTGLNEYRFTLAFAHPDRLILGLSRRDRVLDPAHSVAPPSYESDGLRAAGGGRRAHGASRIECALRGFTPITRPALVAVRHPLDTSRAAKPTRPRPRL